jgi:small subunit ribosomal protein S7
MRFYIRKFKKHPLFDTTKKYRKRGIKMYKQRGKEMRKAGKLKPRKRYSLRKPPRSRFIVRKTKIENWNPKRKFIPRLAILREFFSRVQPYAIAAKENIKKLKKDNINKPLSNKVDDDLIKKEESNEYYFMYKHKLFRICLGHLIKCGEKALAEKALANLFYILKLKLEKNPELYIFDALEKLRPTLGLRPKKRGGIIYRLPFLLRETKRQSMAVLWLISQAKARSGSLSKSLADEICDVVSGTLQGSLKKKEELHRMALSNRPFLS